MHRALPFVAKGDARYALNGVCLAAGPTSVDIVASDTHKLIRVDLKNSASDCAADGTVDAILPSCAMESLCAILRGQESDTLVVVEENFVHFVTDDRALLTVRRVEGQFPRWRDVIPHVASNSPRLILDRKATISTLRRLPVCQETRRVSLSPADGGTTLRLDGDNASTTIRATTTKMPAGVRLDARLFLETLECSSEDHVTLFFRDAENPIRLDDRNVIAVLMPLVRGCGAPPEVSPEDRGAASLEDALKLPDPDPAAFFWRPAKLAKSPKTAKRVSLDAVLAWIMGASEGERERVHTLLETARATPSPETVKAWVKGKARLSDPAVA